MATFKRVMVTSARLFGFHITLTFGALRRNRIVSTAFETIAKKRQRKLVLHMRSVICHEVSRTQPKLKRKCISDGVDALAVG